MRRWKFLAQNCLHSPLKPGARSWTDPTSHRKGNRCKHYCRVSSWSSSTRGLARLATELPSTVSPDACLLIPGLLSDSKVFGLVYGGTFPKANGHHLQKRREKRLYHDIGLAGGYLHWTRLKFRAEYKRGIERRWTSELLWRQKCPNFRVKTIKWHHER